MPCTNNIIIRVERLTSKMAASLTFNPYIRVCTNESITCVPPTLVSLSYMYVKLFPAAVTN